MHCESVAGATDRGRVRPLSAGLLAVTTLALLVLVAWGARTIPARADGEPSASAPAGIAEAKTRLANVYDAYLRGDAGSAELGAAEREVAQLTGEKIPAVASMGRTKLAANFAPMRQVTSFYCGPATVQSILWYLGVRDEAAIHHPETATGMTGRGDVDQKLLAGSSWLNTGPEDGTSWGEVVPRTINAWRGTNWYAAFGTENVGGTLTKDQALRDIVYAIDHGYPVAANVLLSESTVLPTGFYPGYDYDHWETIVGYFDRGGERYVKIGQVYGADGLTYDPLHEIRWDDYWLAIDARYGIVW